MNVARFLLSLIAGLSAALIAFSAVYVRGDVAAVMHFLRERGQVKRFIASGASAEQVAAAKASLLRLAESFADPALATRLIPLELLVGVLAGALVWWLFGQRASGVRLDAQERMVLRFAHRMGGRFTLRDLSERSPLSVQQAHEVTGRMLERGKLRREGEGYTLL